MARQQWESPLFRAGRMSNYDTAYTEELLHCLICGHTDQTGSHDHGHYN